MTQETGMLDVGTHCAYCRQLDFLPFHCKFCNLDFCEIHRTKESHHCQWLLNQEQKVQYNDLSSSNGSNEKFFKSLLPEKGYIRIQHQEQKGFSNYNKPVKRQLNQSAADKLARFFKKSGIYSSNERKGTSSSNRFIQLSELKKTAVGDQNVPVSNRVYIWCCVVPDEEKHRETKRRSFYVNKIWPIGRALDSIAQEFDISNRNNNFKTRQEDKLFLYKIDQSTNEMIQLATSGRVINQISDLDTIYLVRGKEAPTLEA